MSKEITESERLLLAEIQHLEKKLSRQHRGDLREFTKSALQGLCANPSTADWVAGNFANSAINIAEAALAELERRG